MIIEDEELQSLQQSRGRAIEIMDFVDLREIDPIYFVKSYYLSPQETGEKAYNLLREAMKQTGRIAVAKITMRNKQSLAALRVYHNIMIMETIFYPDEVRDQSHVPNIPVDSQLDEKELAMAVKLIENLSAKFDPAKYTDEYRRELLAMIHKKIEGDEVVRARESIPQRNVIDLMQALQESLKETEHLKQSNSAPAKRQQPGRKIPTQPYKERGNKMDWIAPMEPISSSSIPSGEEWIFQIKWDGIRGLTYYQRRQGEIIAYSQNQDVKEPNIIGTASYGQSGCR